MKKILRLIPTVALAMLLTGCYTNVIDLDDVPGGGSDIENPGGLDIGDRSQLNRHIFAESQVCEVTFTSESGWEVNGMDEQTQGWVTLSPTRSDVGGTFTLSIGINENATGSDRFAMLHLMSGNTSEVINIVQQPVYQDGSYPQLYEKDAYTDIVEKITVQNYSDGASDPSSVMEWRFFTNPVDDRVESMSLFQINVDGDKMTDDISNKGWAIEHTIFGTLPGGIDGIVFKTFSEIQTNTYNFISSQKLQEFDYQYENNPIPISREITYQYSNYRRVSARSDHYTSEYRWFDGNMIEQVDVDGNVTGFIYLTADNDRANIDLNTFLSGDLYASMGLFGKRSQNLISSIADYKGGVNSFDYSFDTEGRVHTITRNSFSNGVTEPITTVFTIYYIMQ